MANPERHITIWRLVENVLDWGFHVTESPEEAAQVVNNLKAQGVRQFSTHLLGPKVDDLSSDF